MGFLLGLLSIASMVAVGILVWKLLERQEAGLARRQEEAEAESEEARRR